MSVNKVNSDGSLSKIAGGLSSNELNAIKSDLSVVEISNTTSRAYAQGDCFITSTGQLVRATTAMTAGTTIVLKPNTGYNVEAVSVIELLAEKANTSALGTAAYKNVGSNNGVAELDANGLVPASQLPSFVDDVIEGYYCSVDHLFYEEPIVGGYYYNNVFYTTAEHTTAITPEADKIYWDIPTGDTYKWDTDLSQYLPEDPTLIQGVSGKIYIDLNTGKDTYRWGGSAYATVGSSLALGENSTTAYRGDRGKAAYDHASDQNKITTAQSLGMYKIAITSEGHISAIEQVDASSGSEPQEVVNMNVTHINGISIGLEDDE